MHLNQLLSLIKGSDIDSENTLKSYLEMIHTYIGFTIQFNYYLNNIKLLLYKGEPALNDFALNEILNNNNDSRYDVVINGFETVHLFKKASDIDLSNIPVFSFIEIDDKYKELYAITNSDMGESYSEDLINTFISQSIDDNSDVLDMRMEKIALEYQHQVIGNNLKRNVPLIFDPDDADLNNYVIFRSILSTLSVIINAINSSEKLEVYRKEVDFNLKLLSNLLRLKEYADNIQSNKIEHAIQGDVSLA